MKALYVSLAVIIVDQVSKLWVKGFHIPFLNIYHKGMSLGQMIPVIDDFFRITFVENPGMAFGYDPGDSFKLMISIFSLIASIGLIYYLFVIKDKSWSLRFAIALIIGGAVGNLIDRTFYGLFYNYAPIFYGKVVDFFDFNFFNFTLFGRSYDRWPVFNIADASVTIGVLILIFFYKKHQKQDEEDEAKEIVANSLGDVTTAINTTVGINSPDNHHSAEQNNDEMNLRKLTSEPTDNRKEVSD